MSLTLMVLLAILAVGMLALSSISLRASSSPAAMAEARSNARLALMPTICGLPKQLGPDQPVPARAEILDRTPATSEADEVAYPHYLGLWIPRTPG